MSSQKTNHPNLTKHFGERTFVDPCHAGQRVCRDARNIGMIPVKLDDAEKLISKHADSLALHESFTGEFMVVRKEAATLTI